MFSTIYILEILMTSSEISHHPLLRHVQWSLLIFPDIINGGTCQELSLLLAFLETTRLCEYLLPIHSMIFVKISHIHPTRSAILPLNHSHVFLQIVPYYHCITLKPAVQYKCVKLRPLYQVCSTHLPLSVPLSVV